VGSSLDESGRGAGGGRGFVFAVLVLLLAWHLWARQEALPTAAAALPV